MLSVFDRWLLRLFRGLCISLMFVAVISAVELISSAQIGHAQTNVPDNYSCGNLTSGHCYAAYLWTGSMNGAATNIDVPFLSSGGGYPGFTNWELWVTQYNDTGCSDAGNACWIEAGVTDQYETTFPSYFWADERANAGYHQFMMEEAGPSDLTETFQIYRQNSNAWNVTGSVFSCSYSPDCSTPWSATSTPNAYQPAAIIIGIELAGTSGEGNYGSQWQFNNYRCGNNWCKQSGLGNPGSGWAANVLGDPWGPLSAQWNPPPNNQGNTGDMQASCNSCQ